MLLIKDANGGDPLDPGIAGPAGSDHAEGEPMLHGKRLAVHFVREKGVRVEGFFDREGTLEVGHGAKGNVGAVKQNFASRGFQAGALEHIGESHPAPARVADGTLAPLHTRHRRLEEGAAVAGALEHADELGGGQFLEVVHGEGERHGDGAADLETPLAEIHGRDVNVGADEKMFDGSEIIREAGKRHLEILGADGADQHVALGAIVGFEESSGGEEEEVAAGDAHVKYCYSFSGPNTWSLDADGHLVAGAAEIVQAHGDSGSWDDAGWHPNIYYIQAWVSGDLSEKGDGSEAAADRHLRWDHAPFGQAGEVDGQILSGHGRVGGGGDPNGVGVLDRTLTLAVA